MKRILATAGIAGIALIGVTAPANAGGQGDNDETGDKKVSICHATGSESNPYVQITVSENSLNGNGHALHPGDLIPAPAAGCPGGGHGGGGGKDDDDSDHGADKITICHATGSETNPYVVITISEKAWWNGHKDGHNGHADIYPVPAGGCCPAEEEGEEEEQPPVVTPPEVTPPVVTPPEVTPPEVTPPVVTPPEVTPPVVTPPVQAPAGAAAAPVGAAAATVPVVNRGFNAQTAAGSQPDAGMPAWFGGLAALLGATGLIALRQRGRLQDAPES
ncbi:hypothetical protein [Arthrobacter sp. ISL-72]|uniref:hypothetical protein n=1 Tax=Arthrobacter sp. ISL-72 TaxID=2819114 RepID=UPI001BEB22D0|nr:hypothetical protein [Arthrobacter sp. ISL-72]MBT2596093.1 hypothetical protein [Arthrobacter sp. ISL-72]